LRVLNLHVEDAESNHSGEMEREEETRYASDDHYANAPSPGAYDFLPTETGGPLDQHDDSEYDPGDTDDMGWHDLTRSAAASAAASAGKSRFGDDSDAETQNLPKRFLEEIVSKRNRVRRRSEGRATQREEKKQESAVERTLESDAERRQQRRRRNTVDLNGWAMDDSWDPGTAGRLGLVVGPQDTSDTESSVARLAGVGDAAEAEEVADALSLTESARHPHTAKRSLEDILVRISPFPQFRLPDCPYKTDISFFTIRAPSSTLKRASRATLRGPARLLVPPLTTTTATTTAFPSRTTPWRAFWVTQPRRQPTDPKKRFKKRSTTPSARFPVYYDTFGGKLGCRPRNRLGRSGYGISTLWRCKC
jgi:hypothetical protein